MVGEHRSRNHAELIRHEAIRLGFDACGFSKADFLSDEAPRLEKWLKEGMHGEMSYMENHFDKRLDPRELVPGARSVISLVCNYYPSVEQKEGTPKISKYAYAQQDYHHVVKARIRKLLEFMRNEIGAVEGRGFIDSAPVLDRAWASRSGLGWIGKNSNLITKNRGSYYFLAELIVDIELGQDKPATDHCGTCTRCLDACPTDAIPEPMVVDGSKCISYFTIELKGAISKDMEGRFNDWTFGCDICQQVCPWNKFATPHGQTDLAPHPEFEDMTAKDWEEITAETFQRVFGKSALQRTKYAGLKRNLDFIKKGVD